MQNLLWNILLRSGIWFAEYVETLDGKQGTVQYLNRTVNIEYVDEFQYWIEI